MSTARVTILAPRTVIWLHGTSDPSAADWASGIEKTMRLKEELGVSELRSLDAVLAALHELQKDMPRVKTLGELERAIASSRADARP